MTNLTREILITAEGSKSPLVGREVILIIDKSVKGIIITLHNKNKKWNAFSKK